MVDQRMVDKYIKKLKYIVAESISRKKYRKAMAALSSCARILYNYNQYYTDEDLEEYVIELSRLVKIKNGYTANEKTILFYDGFGFDLRGLAVTYIRALVENHYTVVYITNEKVRHRIPHIINEMKGNPIHFIRMENYLNWVEDINKIFSIYKPLTAFFYTNPNDVAAAVVVRAYEGLVNRIQIDLTDHAFWLGVKSIDFMVTGRMLGASIGVFERGIGREKIIRLDCAPYIDRSICEEQLPFDIKAQKYFFSGGSLYKTLGDPDLLYYKIVNDVLAYDKEIIFLYAGSGDASQMNVLKALYPGRVYLINERTDFFSLIENAEFFLNTYPMFGGLMMRFSAIAGKLPLTLKHEDDSAGILENQSDLGIEFDSYEELIDEIKKSLSDLEYRHRKELALQTSVMSEKEFRENLKKLVEHHITDYSFGELVPIDTSRFRKEYLERFDYFQDIVKEIALIRNGDLVFNFPKEFLVKTRSVLRRKIFNGKF